MKDLAGRRLLIAVAAALMILMIPAMMAAMGVRAPGLEEAHAGEGIDIDDVIKGKNSDGTVDPGATLSVSLNDLDAKKAGIKDLYNQDKLDITWVTGEFGDEKVAETTYSGGEFSTKITLRDAKKKVWLSIGCKNGFDDTGYNMNSSQIEVYSGTITINYGPSLNTTYLRTITGLLSRNYEVTTDGQTLSYTCQNSGKTYYSSDFMVTLLNADNNKVLKTVELSGSKAIFKNVKVSYTKTIKFKVQLSFFYGDEEKTGGSITFTDKAEKIGNNKVYATKITSNQAILRWTGVSGATGYYVYQGSKKVKTVKSTARKVTIKRKKAGTSKFRVIPYVKASGKAYKGGSNKVKPKANVYKRSISKSYSSDGYAKGSVRVQKISGKGKKYTATLYAYNNRIFKLVKYKKISLKVYADGKLIGKKTIKNKKVNMKENSVKKITLKFKGKVGDLKNGTVTYSIRYTPLWEHGYKAW